MTLRTRATLIISASFAALIAFLLAAAMVVVLGRFHKLENDEARRDVERAAAALNDEAAGLAATTSDWAHWDDAAGFVTGGKGDFRKSNLMDDTFLTLRLDIAAFLGPDGKLVYLRVYDRAGHHDGPAPAGLAAALAPGSTLVRLADGASHREGFLVLPGGIFLAASQPITDSYNRSPPVGTLVFAREMDAAEMKRVSKVLQQPTAIMALDRSGLTPTQVKEGAASPRVFVNPDGPMHFNAILPVRDILGRVSVAINVKGTRLAYQEALLSIRYLAGSLVACSVLSALLLYLLISRMVLSPLFRMSTAVRGIGATGGTGRLSAAGKDELSEVARSINGMLDALAASESRRTFLEERLSHVNKLEAIGTLAGGVAHDFNNILMAITGFCDLLDESVRADAEAPRAGSARAEVEEIRKASARAASLTAQLLAFSRRQRLQFQVLDMNRLLSEMAEMLRRLLGEHLTLRMELQPGLDHLRGDLGQLQQVIMNLAVNARDAMPGGGTLTVRTENVRIVRRDESERLGLPPGSYVRCTVADTGSGMDEDVQRRIFEPFFTTKELGRGTGLGLSVVWGIVKQCDGTVSVTSEPGKGSSFDIYLPAAGGAPEAAGAPPHEGPTPATGNGTVLVVEDEAAIRLFIAKALSRAGYHVLEASDGEEALRLAHTLDAAVIRLLLTDVVMPRMGGAELARALKERFPAVKVLFMSGNADLQGSLGPSEAGVPLLQKPFNTRRLVEAVANLLEG